MTYDAEKVKAGREHLTIFEIDADQCAADYADESTNINPTPNIFTDWVPTSASVTADTTIAPDGTTTADTVEDASAVIGGRITKDLALTGPIGTRITFGLAIKQDSQPRVARLDLAANSNFVLLSYLFSPADGTSKEYLPEASAFDTGITVAKEGDWWWVSLTIHSSVAITDATMRFYPAAGPDINNYNPSTTGTLDVWGAHYIVNGGKSTCYARLSDKCHKTRNTCQVPGAYDGSGTQTLKLCTSISNEALMGSDEKLIPILDKRSINIAPSEIQPGKGIGKRANLSVKVQDIPYHDRGIDPYIYTRSYSQEDQGTLLGRYLARNPFFTGRECRLKTGYITSPWDSSNFKTRTYFLDSIDGPDSGDNYTFKAKDLLKAIDDDKSLAPTPSTGTLSANLNAGVTSGFTITGGAGEYGASGRVAIGDEIISYTTGVDSGDDFVITTITRGVDGTSDQNHDLGDTVQLCVRFDNSNPIDVTRTLITTYAGVNALFINDSDWNTERDKWFSAQSINRTIAEPTGVKELIESLSEEFLFNIWWDEIDSEIKLRAIRPPDIDGLSTFTDESHLMKATVKANVKDRLSRVIVHYGALTDLEGDKPSHFRYTHAAIDLEAESESKFNEQKIKVIYARWISATGPALQLAGRTLANFSENAKIIDMELDAKDSDLWSGGLFYVDSKKIQDVTGLNDVTLFQATRAFEDEAGDKYRYRAQSSSFKGRYGYIMPDGSPDYSIASDEQKESGCYICYDSGVFYDGTEAYKII